MMIFGQKAKLRRWETINAATRQTVFVRYEYFVKDSRGETCHVLHDNELTSDIDEKVSVRTYHFI